MDGYVIEAGSQSAQSNEASVTRRHEMPARVNAVHPIGPAAQREPLPGPPVPMDIRSRRPLDVARPLRAQDEQHGNENQGDGEELAYAHDLVSAGTPRITQMNCHAQNREVSVSIGEEPGNRG